MGCYIIQEVGDTKMYIFPGGGGVSGSYVVDGGEHIIIHGSGVEQEDTNELLDHWVCSGVRGVIARRSAY